MNVHKNARLTPRGRALMVSRILVEGWPVAAAARAAGVSERTAHKWLGRRRRGPSEDFNDRSSAPRRCPRRTLPQRIAEIERLRRQRMSGLAIARELRMPRATVGAVLRRLGLGKLAALQPREPVIRYERERPGELLHLDIKSLGKIDGVGHRITGDRTAQSRKRGIGWDHLHVAIDDASRLPTPKSCPA